MAPVGWRMSDGAIEQSGDDRSIARRRFGGVSVVSECVGLDG
jgi:hypothetical protein